MLWTCWSLIPLHISSLCRFQVFLCRCTRLFSEIDRHWAIFNVLQRWRSRHGRTACRIHQNTMCQQENDVSRVGRCRHDVDRTRQNRTMLKSLWCLWELPERGSIIDNQCLEMFGMYVDHCWSTMHPAQASWVSTSPALRSLGGPTM